MSIVFCGDGLIIIVIGTIRPRRRAVLGGRCDGNRTRATVQAADAMLLFRGPRRRRPLPPPRHACPTLSGADAVGPYQFREGVQWAYSTLLPPPPPFSRRGAIISCRATADGRRVAAYTQYRTATHRRCPEGANLGFS